MSIRIVSDSTCDLPESVAAKYGIRVVPGYINIEGESYLDGVEISRREFYERLPHCKELPSTSAAGPGAFVRAYQELAEEGATQILSIHISATLSGMMTSAHAAAQATDEVEVTVLDSGQLTLGTGYMAIAAAEAAADGHSMEEVLALIEDMMPRTYAFAALDTLEYLHKGGRVSHVQYGLGSVLRIKPLLIMHDGELTMERVRTRKQALARTIELIREVAPLERLAVVHANALERGEELAQRVRDLFPWEEHLSVDVTPVIGAHVGPGSVGLVGVSASGKR